MIDRLALIDLLEEIESKIEETEELNLDGTIYEDEEELLDDVEAFIVELEDGNLDTIEYLSIHFLENSTFQMLAKQNNWGDVFRKWNITYENIIKAK